MHRSGRDYRTITAGIGVMLGITFVRRHLPHSESENGARRLTVELRSSGVSFDGNFDKISCRNFVGEVFRDEKKCGARKDSRIQ